MTDPGSRPPILADASTRIEAGSHVHVPTDGRDLTAVGQRIVESLRALLGVVSSSLRLLAPDGSLVGIAWAGEAQSHYQPGHIVPPGMGLIGRVVQEGRPLWTSEVTADPAVHLTEDMRERLRRVGARALLAVPLRVDGSVVGTLSVADPVPRAFSEREVTLLEAFADQAATALKNTRLHEEAARRRREAEVVAELARTISASLEVDTVLQRVADGARELCGASVAVIALPDDRGERLRARYCSGVKSPAYRQVEVERGKGIGGLVLQTGRPFRTADYAADPRITKDYLALTLEEGVGSHLAVPILMDGRVEGIVNVGNPAGQPFTDEDERILTSLAGHGSVALRNARLYQEAERRRRAAESLAEVGRLVSQSLDATEVARRIAESIRTLLGALASTLYRLEPESGELVALAVSDADASVSASGRNLVLPRGTGLSGVAVREGRGVSTPDILTDPRVTLTPEGQARTEQSVFRAGLAVPLVAKGAVLGALAVGDRAGRRFDEEEIRLAQAFADQAATALANARLFEDAERQRREAEILAELTGTIGATLTLDTVLQRVADGARDLCGGDLAEIALWDPASHAMRFHYWAGLNSPDHRTVRVEPGKGMGGQVILTGRPQRTDDYERDSRFTKDYLPQNSEEGLVAELVVPILRDGRVDGLLYVSRRSPRPFTDRDEAILVRLAEHASIAITNARLYEQSERRRQEAGSLAEVGQLVTQSLDVTEVGQRIVDSVRRLLGDVTANLYRMEPTTGDLVTLAISGNVGPAWPAGVVMPRGAGVSGRAVAERRPIATLDALADPTIEIPPDLRARAQRAGYRSVLSVPLLIQDRVIGALALGREAGRGFDEEETRLAQAFADQAAVALENARLFEEQTRLLKQTRRQHDEALALELVGRQITSSLEREAVFERIVDRTRLLCDCDVAYLATYDPATETAPIVAVSGARSEALLTVTMARGWGLGGKVLETGEPCTSDDYLHDLTIPRPFVEAATAEGTVAEAVVPLQLRGATVGLLGAINRTPRRFTQKDVGLLSKFAVQAATALENSRLYAERVRVEVELRVRARQQAAIAELGQRALAGPEVGAVIEEAIGLVAQTLDVEYCNVLELLPGGEVLLLRAGVGWKAGYVGRATVGAGSGSQAGYTLLRGEPVVVEDLGSERRFSGPPLLHEHGVVSGVSVVIRGPGRPFGVLAAHTRQRRTFTTDDVHFLQSVANVLATAIGRQRAENALRESEERFRAAFEQSRIGRALQRLDGRYLRVNRALCEILGYTEEELLRTTWQAITESGDLEAGLERSARALAEGALSYQAEKRYRHKAGHVVWVALSVSLVRDADGHPVHYLSEIEDITPRKRAEEALQRHVERLKILHKIDQAIVAARSPETIAQAALRRIRRLVPCRRASVTLFDFEAQEARVLAVDSAAASTLPAGSRLPLASIGDIDDLRAGVVRLVEDVRSLVDPPALTRALRAEGMLSYVAVPLRSQSTLVGALGLSDDAPGAFSREQIEIAAEVAASLAVALQDSRLFAQVLAGRERLQALSRRLVDLQEAERRHVARELHDEIGQLLTGLKLALEASGGATETLGEARRIVNDLIRRVRELSLDLRPPMLDDFGLLSALLWHFERYTAQTGIRVKFEHLGLDARFPAEVETAAYRIVQEALTNVARHAGVGEVAVQTWADDRVLTATVEDHGRGFDRRPVPASSGLGGMRERALLLGGQLTIESAPGAGTRVTAELPLQAPLERRDQAR